MGAGQRRPWSPETALALAGLTMVALALRLPSFGDSLWGDELSTNFVVNGFGVGDIFEILRSDQEGSPPLFFVLTWATKGLGGVEGLRAVSLIAGLAAIPLTYLLGVRTVGRAAGMVGAALLALSAFQIFYATEARPYELMMCLCLVASLTLLVAIDSGRARWWVAYGLATAAAAYTHYAAIFVLVVLLAWGLIAQPRERKWLILASLGAAVLYVPWLPTFMDDRLEPAATNVEALHPLTLDAGATDVLDLSVGHPFISAAEMPGDFALWLIGSGLAVGVLALLLGRGGGGEPKREALVSSRVVLVVCLALAAPVGAALHNVFGPSVFLPRNLLASWPGLALSAGALVTAGRAPLRQVAVGLLLAGFAIGAARMLEEDHGRPDYADAARFIEQEGDPGSPVVDSIILTPGPQTALEAALAPKGEAAPDRPVLTLRYPPLEDRLRIRREGQSILTPIPAPDEREIAEQAARDAGTGTLFIVSGGTSLETLRTVPEYAAVLDALPPRFRHVESRSFPGLGQTGITVHVLRGDS